MFEVYLYEYVEYLGRNLYIKMPLGHRTSSLRTSSERLTYIQFRLAIFCREGDLSGYSNIATR